MKQQVRYGAETRGRAVDGGVLQEGEQVYWCGDLPLAYFACQPNFFHNRLPCSEGGKGKACPEEGERRTIQLEERNARKLHPVWTSS